MRPTSGERTPHGESGFALIEVLISGVIAVIAATGVMALMQTSVHTASDQRNRTQAYSLAQEDQARLRAMRIPTMKVLTAKGEEIRPVTIDGLKFEVKSKVSFVTDATGTVSCGSSADYARISSEVTWANMSPIKPTVINSIVAAPSGSFAADSGTLSVTVLDDSGVGVPGIGLTGAGKSSFSGSTDEEGCAVFTELPEGEYTVTASGTNLVDKEGQTPTAIPITVNAEQTATLNPTYDYAGSAKLKFTTKTYSGAVVPNGVNTMIEVHSGLQTTKLVGTVEGTNFTEKEVPSLFPFSTTYSFYAGACTAAGGNNPGAGAAIANLLVPPAGSVEGTIQMPALLAKVWTGKNSSNAGSAFANADVWVEDEKCLNSAAKPILRRFTTNSSGQLNEPGLPWSTYDLCADTNGSSPRRQRIPNVPVQNLTTGTVQNFYLGSGSGTVSQSGSCP